jgi:hypothetical protein
MSAVQHARRSIRRAFSNLVGLGSPRPSRRAVRGRRWPTPLNWQNYAPLNNQTLLLPEYKLGIIWSPKAACTKVLLWYFKQLDLLPAVLFYHPGPHRYRINVLYNSREYRKWLEKSPWREFSWYQFCRDPVKRALSSYRHNLVMGNADHAISRALGRKVSSLEGYSLNEFIQYLATLDLLGKVDPHVRLQKNSIADVVRVNRINIDQVDMLLAMNTIERNHGLPVTDFAEFSAFGKDDLRRARIELAGSYSPTMVLSRKEANGKWPVHSAMLDAATIERIKQIYKDDMEFIYERSVDDKLLHRGD